MGDILSALIPPAVVAAVFCTFVVKLLRKEMAPRTSDGRLVSEVDDATGSAQGDAAAASPAGAAAVAPEDGAKGAEGASPEVPADRGDAADR
ncbi:hypothetical protein HNR23_005088 [Nocardiopsis mwathae]|uniref:Uncharacterized protein n=1 Tax=Nocardiopsis mwathae TaxID=1472723 RepID=A0A7W9YMQ8_9ACTN|nr:hypothetical protein [Nocardiopsis mwathae]MBB6175028.1 hypothetical protein [Nocardiopsis mwathae]